VRDFRGVPKKGFDGQGNYNIGFKEHTVFPEISPDDVMHLHGLQICINTTAQNDETGFELLKALGFPFKKEQSKKEEPNG
ncbi:50S ribosomal protein L5, partial [Candidatus Peregrinibacteria bacterium]|nr:50S ribosomal protein L5 [Candidatus Peregrinibacteria bacterium]